MTLPGLSTGAAVVFGLVALAGVLFASDRWPNEVVALGIAVLLPILGPWTGVGPREAISGFASPATVTVLAMFILSEAVRSTGVVERLALRLLPWAQKSEGRRLAAVLGLAGPPAGFVNNTPLVAVLIPTVVTLARRCRSSPSRLLLPLSFVTMMGGTLTLIGTSTNLLASDFSDRLLGRPIGFFEFTALGLLVLAAGALYLMTVGRRLLPERIRPEEDFTQKFRMRDYLHRARVPASSPLVGKTLAESQEGEAYDLDVLQIVRDGTAYLGPTTDQRVEAGDELVVRADASTLERFVDRTRLEAGPLREVTDADFLDRRHTLLEVTVAPDSDLAGKTVVTGRFRERFHATVLAVQRGEEVTRDRVQEHELRVGDSLLVLASRASAALMDELPGLVVSRSTPLETELEARGPWEEPEEVPPGPRGRRTAVVLLTMAGVVAAAAAGLIPVYLAALAGVVVMIGSGAVDPKRAYAAVGWDIVFLLAGLIPLGVAMERSGAADYLAGVLLAASGSLPAVAVLGLFYLATGLLANLISNNASAVLMIPVAVEAARTVGGDPFSFLLAVMFAASTAFMTPVGYLTNLMVYTPGGYRYSDYVRVGAPLQLLLALVTTAGIALIWGV